MLCVEKNYKDNILNTKHVCVYIFPGGNDSFMSGSMPSSGMQDMYPRGPPQSMGMGIRPQYPYSQGFDRRSVIYPSKLQDNLAHF